MCCRLFQTHGLKSKNITFSSFMLNILITVMNQIDCTGSRGDVFQAGQVRTLFLEEGVTDFLTQGASAPDARAWNLVSLIWFCAHVSTLSTFGFA
jgi:hypothetical protein